MGMNNNLKSEEVIIENLYDQFMVIFGVKYDIEEGNMLRLALFIAYAFLISIVNLKLLISIIGEMFQKQQISRVPMCFKMKATFLIEYAKIHQYFN